MPDPQDPTGAITRNLFTLQRLGNTIAADGFGLLERIRDEIIQDLRKIDPTGPSIERWRRYRTEQFVEAARERMSDGSAEWLKLTRQELAQSGRAQAKWAEATLVSTLGPVGGEVRATTVTQARLKAILDSRPFDGRMLSEEAERLGRSTADQISAELRRGMSQEESMPDLVRRIRGRQQGFIRQDPNTGQFVRAGTRGADVRPRFVGGVWATTTRHAEAVARTFTNAVANEAHMQTYRDNARLMRGVMFSATLDESTTVLCASLDGAVWPLDDDAIQQPPLHYRCRSQLVPQVDWEGVGLEPPTEGVRAAREMDVEDGQVRRGKTTRVRSSVRYEQWLRGQPVAVQEEVLGVRRARLWRDGKIESFRELLTGDGRMIPLDQLPDAA
jgi:SPP1 gp7 family putative phage head morphogenesis protein